MNSEAVTSGDSVEADNTAGFAVEENLECLQSLASKSLIVNESKNVSELQFDAYGNITNNNSNSCNKEFSNLNNFSQTSIGSLENISNSQKYSNNSSSINEKQFTKGKKKPSPSIGLQHHFIMNGLKESTGSINNRCKKRSISKLEVVFSPTSRYGRTRRQKTISDEFLTGSLNLKKISNGNKNKKMISPPKLRPRKQETSQPNKVHQLSQRLEMNSLESDAENLSLLDLKLSIVKPAINSSKNEFNKVDNLGCTPKRPAKKKLKNNKSDEYKENMKQIISNKKSKKGGYSESDNSLKSIPTGKVNSCKKNKVSSSKSEKVKLKDEVLLKIDPYSLNEIAEVQVNNAEETPMRLLVNGIKLEEQCLSSPENLETKINMEIDKKKADMLIKTGIEASLKDFEKAGTNDSLNSIENAKSTTKKDLADTEENTVKSLVKKKKVKKLFKYSQKVKQHSSTKGKKLLKKSSNSKIMKIKKEIANRKTHLKNGTLLVIHTQQEQIVPVNGVSDKDSIKFEYNDYKNAKLDLPNDDNQNSVKKSADKQKFHKMPSSSKNINNKNFPEINVNLPLKMPKIMLSVEILEMAKTMPFKFALGDVVWVIMKGNPLWPGMIIQTSDTYEHMRLISRKNSKSDKKTWCYHVLFFNDRGHSNWLSELHLVKYEGLEALCIFGDSLIDKDQNDECIKDPQHRKVLMIFSKMVSFMLKTTMKTRYWYQAVKDADKALSLELLPERLYQCNPNIPKSGMNNNLLSKNGTNEKQFLVENKEFCKEKSMPAKRKRGRPKLTQNKDNSEIKLEEMNNVGSELDVKQLPETNKESCMEEAMPVKRKRGPSELMQNKVISEIKLEEMNNFGSELDVKQLPETNKESCIEEAMPVKRKRGPSELMQNKVTSEIKLEEMNNVGSELDVKQLPETNKESCIEEAMPVKRKRGPSELMQNKVISEIELEEMNNVGSELVVKQLPETNKESCMEEAMPVKRKRGPSELMQNKVISEIKLGEIKNVGSDLDVKQLPETNKESCMEEAMPVKRKRGPSELMQNKVISEIKLEEINNVGSELDVKQLAEKNKESCLEEAMPVKRKRGPSELMQNKVISEIKLEEINNVGSELDVKQLAKKNKESRLEAMPVKRKRGHPELMQNSEKSEINESKNVDSNPESSKLDASFDSDDFDFSLNDNFNEEFFGFGKNSAPKECIEDRKKKLKDCITGMGDFDYFANKYIAEVKKKFKLNEVKARKLLTKWWNELTPLSKSRYRRQTDSPDTEDTCSTTSTKLSYSKRNLKGRSRSTIFVPKNEKVCAKCETVSKNNGSDMVKCKGVCHNSFHVDCLESDWVTKVDCMMTKSKTPGKKCRNVVDKSNRHTKNENNVGANKDLQENLNKTLTDEVVKKVDNRKLSDSNNEGENKSSETSAEIKSCKPVKSEENVLKIGVDKIDETNQLETNNNKSDKKTELGENKRIDTTTNPKQNEIHGKENIFKNYKCADCIRGIQPCFICESSEGVRIRCSVKFCAKYYHEKCVQNSHTTMSQYSYKFEKLLCPRHFCHICAANADDYNDPIAKMPPFTRCLRCPTTYHVGENCLAAGTKEISYSAHICSKHFQVPKTNANHINVSWCFCCSEGGSLLLCDQCPAAFHAECLNISAPEGSFVCEDCQNGKFPVYGDILWVKLGAYRWWPAEALHPRNVPDNIDKLKHAQGMLCVHFFGSDDYYWVSRGRVFQYQEEDQGSKNSSNKQLQMKFDKALNEALVVFRRQKALRDERNKSLTNIEKPAAFVKIDVNKPAGNVKLPKLDLSAITKCDCDPHSEEPCDSDDKCINRMLMTECVREVCLAQDRCKNQRFQRRIYPDIYTFKTAIGRGWGLKTKEAIKKGTFVIEYVGELIDDLELRRRMDRMHDLNEQNYYFLTIETNLIIDAGPKGNLARFMNHSCEPNCVTQKWTVGVDTRVGLFALKDIADNEELTFNYNLLCIGTNKKKCFCNAPNCSGFIGEKVQKVQELSTSHKEKDAKKKKGRKKRGKKDIETDWENECFRCGEPGNLILCDNSNCPKGYHLACLDLKTMPRGQWICPWHHCDDCGTRSSVKCQLCPNSFCKPHSVDRFREINGLLRICKDHQLSESFEKTLRGEKEQQNLTKTQEIKTKENLQDIQKEISSKAQKKVSMHYLKALEHREKLKETQNLDSQKNICTEKLKETQNLDCQKNICTENLNTVKDPRELMKRGQDLKSIWSEEIQKNGQMEVVKKSGKKVKKNLKNKNKLKKAGVKFAVAPTLFKQKENLKTEKKISPQILKINLKPKKQEVVMKLKNTPSTAGNKNKIKLTSIKTEKIEDKAFLKENISTKSRKEIKQKSWLSSQKKGLLWKKKQVLSKSPFVKKAAVAKVRHLKSFQVDEDESILIKTAQKETETFLSEDFTDSKSSKFNDDSNQVPVKEEAAGLFVDMKCLHTPESLQRRAYSPELCFDPVHPDCLNAILEEPKISKTYHSDVTFVSASKDTNLEKSHVTSLIIKSGEKILVDTDNSSNLNTAEASVSPKNIATALVTNAFQANFEKSSLVGNTTPKVNSVYDGALSNTIQLRSDNEISPAVKIPTPKASFDNSEIQHKIGETSLENGEPVTCKTTRVFDSDVTPLKTKTVESSSDSGSALVKEKTSESSPDHESLPEILEPCERENFVNNGELLNNRANKGSVHNEAPTVMKSTEDVFQKTSINDDLSKTSETSLDNGSEYLEPKGKDFNSDNEVLLTAACFENDATSKSKINDVISSKTSFLTIKTTTEANSDDNEKILLNKLNEVSHDKEVSPVKSQTLETTVSLTKKENERSSANEVLPSLENDKFSKSKNEICFDSNAERCEASFDTDNKTLKRKTRRTSFDNDCTWLRNKRPKTSSTELLKYKTSEVSSANDNNTRLARKMRKANCENADKPLQKNARADGAVLVNETSKSRVDIYTEQLKSETLSSKYETPFESETSKSKADDAVQLESKTPKTFSDKNEIPLKGETSKPNDDNDAEQLENRTPKICSDKNKTPVNGETSKPKSESNTEQLENRTSKLYSDKKETLLKDKTSKANLADIDYEHSESKTPKICFDKNETPLKGETSKLNVYNNIEQLEKEILKKNETPLKEETSESNADIEQFGNQILIISSDKHGTSLKSRTFKSNADNDTEQLENETLEICANKNEILLKDKTCKLSADDNFEEVENKTSKNDSSKSETLLKGEASKPNTDNYTDTEQLKIITSKILADKNELSLNSETSVSKADSNTELLESKTCSDQNESPLKGEAPRSSANNNSKPLVIETCEINVIGDPETLNSKTKVHSADECIPATAEPQNNSVNNDCGPVLRRSKALKPSSENSCEFVESKTRKVISNNFVTFKNKATKFGSGSGGAVLRNRSNNGGEPLNDETRKLSSDDNVETSKNKVIKVNSNDYAILLKKKISKRRSGSGSKLLKSKMFKAANGDKRTKEIKNEIPEVSSDNSDTRLDSKAFELSSNEEFTPVIETPAVNFADDGEPVKIPQSPKEDTKCFKNKVPKVDSAKEFEMMQTQVSEVRYTYKTNKISSVIADLLQKKNGSEDEITHEAKEMKLPSKQSSKLDESEKFDLEIPLHSTPFDNSLFDNSAHEKLTYEPSISDSACLWSNIEINTSELGTQEHKNSKPSAALVDRYFSEASKSYSATSNSSTVTELDSKISRCVSKSLKRRKYLNQSCSIRFHNNISPEKFREWVKLTKSMMGDVILSDFVDTSSEKNNCFISSNNCNSELEASLNKCDKKRNLEISDETCQTYNCNKSLERINVPDNSSLLSSDLKNSSSQSVDSISLEPKVDINLILSKCVVQLVSKTPKVKLKKISPCRTKYENHTFKDAVKALSEKSEKTELIKQLVERPRRSINKDSFKPQPKMFHLTRLRTNLKRFNYSDNRKRRKLRQPKMLINKAISSLSKSKNKKKFNLYKNQKPKELKSKDNKLVLQGKQQKSSRDECKRENLQKVKSLNAKVNNKKFQEIEEKFENYKVGAENVKYSPFKIEYQSNKRNLDVGECKNKSSGETSSTNFSVDMEKKMIMLDSELQNALTDLSSFLKNSPGFKHLKTNKDFEIAAAKNEIKMPEVLGQRKRLSVRKDLEISLPDAPTKKEESIKIQANFDCNNLEPVCKKARLDSDLKLQSTNANIELNCSRNKSTEEIVKDNFTECSYLDSNPINTSLKSSEINNLYLKTKPKVELENDTSVIPNVTDINFPLRPNNEIDAEIFNVSGRENKRLYSPEIDALQ